MEIKSKLCCTWATNKISRVNRQYTTSVYELKNVFLKLASAKITIRAVLVAHKRAQFYMTAKLNHVSTGHLLPAWAHGAHEKTRQLWLCMLACSDCTQMAHVWGLTLINTYFSEASPPSHIGNGNDGGYWCKVKLGPKIRLISVVNSILRRLL